MHKNRHEQKREREVTPKVVNKHIMLDGVLCNISTQHYRFLYELKSWVSVFFFLFQQWIHISDAVLPLLFLSNKFRQHFRYRFERKATDKGDKIMHMTNDVTAIDYNLYNNKRLMRVLFWVHRNRLTKASSARLNEKISQNLHIKTDEVNDFISDEMRQLRFTTILEVAVACLKGN